MYKFLLCPPWFIRTIAVLNTLQNAPLYVIQGIQLVSGRENSKTLTVINGGYVSNSTSGRESGEIINLLKVRKYF